ncbi:MAG: GNAT family N-acetyltransferase [Verrucomicrobiota bacterium]
MTQNLSRGRLAGSPDFPQAAAGTFEPAVTTLTPAHRVSAVATLVQAFAEDPVAVHLFPDPADRPAGMAHIFQMGLRYAQRYGQIDGIQSAGAVAVWIRPPYATPSRGRLVRAGILTTPFIVGWRATRRMLRYEHFIESCRMQALAVPHWYLFCVGVRPEQQGQGLGAALIQHGLQRGQAAGVPCYLETSNVRNLPFYQKHGFRLAGQWQPPDAGPPVWGLVAESN